MVAMSIDSFETVLDDMYAAYPSSLNLALKPTHQQIGHVAHGWFMRVKRSCEVVMLLREGGFGSEAWPMRRNVIEHVLALRWLAEKGNDARDVVIRAHGESARRRQEAASGAGWASAGWPVWEEVREDAEAATGNITESNILTNVRERCDRYGQPSDFAGWLIETNNSHPSWETAQPYLDPGPPVRLLESPRWDGSLGDAEFCASRMLRSLVSLGDMLIDPPWASEIGKLTGRLVLLRGSD